jgi:hypothetical protein
MEGQVIIRSATAADIPAIWRLLHSEGRTMDDGVIAAALARLYVLARGKTLVGVYHAGRRDGGAQVWAAVHPLFGERLVEEIMALTVNGLLADNFADNCGVREWSFSSTSRRSSLSISS